VLFDKLLERDELVPAINQRGFAIGGVVEWETGYVSELQIRIDRDELSAVGLRYLARFLVRLDFPNAKAYFTRNNRTDVQDPTATSGMTILQRDGQKTVHAVRSNSAAEHAGIHAGDVIEFVDGVDAAALDMFSLGRLLTSEVGRSVAVRVRSNSGVKDAHLVLRSQLPRVGIGSPPLDASR
jgi:hypothetical protein